jgi:hypothetical protein
MEKLPMSQDGQSRRRENDGAQDQTRCTGCRHSDQGVIFPSRHARIGMV